MNNSNIEYRFILQDIYTSTSTLALMVDSTFRSIEEMYSWPYFNKDEMKELGGKISQMTDKSMEFFLLGISKMVEDFFNNLEQFGNIKLDVWDSSLESIMFSKEIRFIRRLGNIIKHHNSVIDSSKGNRDAKELIAQYGFKDDTPIHWLNIFKGQERDSILQYIYKANYFCMNILDEKGLIGFKRQPLEEGEMVEHMIKYFIHSIPGHPNNRNN